MFRCLKDDKDRVTAKYKERCGWRIHAAKFGWRHSRLEHIGENIIMAGISRTEIWRGMVGPEPCKAF